ncbi:hypothetical protein [Priestia koreensis]|uniref:hypothetical protein n=1 Tax=Priestia koreensis TaxID=284581 RepID=UPI0020418257|nr:hypothetical protein [Priestia koreensis]MCM3006821.1 hypothetical protein [Priestia koreensis]
MKKKFIGSALALSLFLGGATLNSTSAQAAPLHEKNIKIEQVSTDKVEPHFWAVVGRAAAKGAAWGIGYVAGEKAARSVFGSSTSDSSNYEYNDVKSSFDL